MILPIVAYGDTVLRKIAVDISPDFAGLSTLIEDMFETMYKARGVGLAAPQIGQAIRLFVVDASPYEENPELKGFKRVFINAKKISEEGEPWLFNEGCLSIPEIREEVERKGTIKLTYFDASFVEKEEEFVGVAGRIIQHEYDHIEGKLFTDYLSPLKKRMLEGRLSSISKGEVEVEYKMKFPSKKKGKS